MRGMKTAATSAAMVVFGGAWAAQAADLAVKAPPVAAAGPSACTSIVDFFTTSCQVTGYGVRFYGALNVGATYQTNGAPHDNQYGNGMTYFPQKMNNGGKFGITANPFGASYLGLQINEPLAQGWSFVAQLEVQVDPTSGTLANSPGSLRDQVGVPLALERGVSDGSVNGQFYNSLGFFGFSSDTWGTLTFLRQGTLMRDATIAYDPIPSYAFSLVGATGAISGGGDTQNVRDTTAVKYRVNLGDWRFGVFGQAGGYNQGNSAKGTIEGSVGADFRIGGGVLSADLIGGFTKDAVSESLAGFAVDPNTGVGIAGSAATGVSATISDNTNVMLVAKYTVQRLTLYAGWEWMQFANPSEAVTGAFTDISGFTITNPSNTGFPRDKILQVAWTGARYSITPTLDVLGAYYHYWQNDFSNAAATVGSGSRTTCAVVTTALSSCAGAQDAVSAVLDWQFAPKWDTFVGTMYTRLNGGLDSGFLARDNWVTTAGVRLRW